MLTGLKGEQFLVRVFALVFGFQELFTPRFAGALRTFINRIADGETVIAGSFRAVARKLVTRFARLEEFAFESPVLAHSSRSQTMHISPTSERVVPRGICLRKL